MGPLVRACRRRFTFGRLGVPCLHVDRAQVSCVLRRTKGDAIQRPPGERFASIGGGPRYRKAKPPDRRGGVSITGRSNVVCPKAQVAAARIINTILNCAP